MQKHVSIPAWGGEGRGSHPEGATRPLEGRLLMAGAARISSGSSTMLLSLSFVGDLLRNKMNERWASANSAGSENVNSYSSSASSASSRVLKGVCPRPAPFIDWVIFLSEVQVSVGTSNVGLATGGRWLFQASRSYQAAGNVQIYLSLN